MRHTLLLTASLILLTLAAAPSAEANHDLGIIPEENGSCVEVYTAWTGWFEVCALSDTGWCWLFHHCPL